MTGLAGSRTIAAYPGLTLVELLISLALMSFILLSCTNFLMKSSATSGSLSMRFRESGEIQMMFMDILRDFRQGASISDNSHDKRLEYTTYSSTGVATKKIYRITTISGYQYLQLSTDGGTTWDSPYRISSYDDYYLSGTPRFLYAWAVNNCTDFVDSTANGVWLSGSDTAGSYLSCAEGTSSPALSTPSQATKVDFQGFRFTTGKGSPEATRSLPTDFFLPVNTALVRSNSAAVSPAAKDSPLLKAFVTNTANSLFGTTFDVQSAAWDNAQKRLVIVGDKGTTHTVYLSDRLGVLIRSGLTTSANTIKSYGVAVKGDGDNILVLGTTDSGSTWKLYGFDVSGSAPLSTSSTLSLSGIVNSPKSIAYDEATPSDFYVVGTNTSTSALEITERSISAGALVGTAWALPAAFDSTHPPGGLAIDPVTGNFLVVRNYVNGSSPNKTIDIYIITRATGSSSYFSVNIDDLGSTATGTTGKWGLGYDAVNNLLFLSDSATDKIYEVIPSQIISPQS